MIRKIIGADSRHKQTAMWLAVICLVALVLRAGVVYKLGRVLSWSDERVYATLGYNVARGYGYSVEDPAIGYQPTMFVPPGQAGFAAAAFVLLNPFFPEDPSKIIVIAKCLLALIGVLTCLYAYGIAFELTKNRTAGLLAALGIGIYPAYVYASSTFYPIVLLTFFCAAAAYYTIRAKNGRLVNRSAALAGFLIGLAALTAAYELLIAPLAALWLLGVAKSEWKKRFAPAAILFVTAGLTVLPWMIRNYIIFRQPTISANLGTCLRLGYFGAKLMPDGRVALMKDEPTQASVAGLSEAQADLERRTEAIAAIKQNPGHYLELCVGKFKNFWDSYPRHPITGRQPKKMVGLVQTFSVWTIYVGAILALLLVPRMRGYFGLAALFIFPTLMSCVLTISTARYRYPLDTMFIVPTAVAMASIPEWLAKRQTNAKSAASEFSAAK